MPTPGETSPASTASIAVSTSGMPYPYCSFHGPGGAPCGCVQDAASTETASGPVSALGMRWSVRAVSPYERRRAMMPPSVGVDSDVLPPPVATENAACGPQDVRSDRVQYGPGTALWLHTEEGSPEVFATRPLPASTPFQYMPPWWSGVSKSLLASTTTIPRASM